MRLRLRLLRVRLGVGLRVHLLVHRRVLLRGQWHARLRLRLWRRRGRDRDVRKPPLLDLEQATHGLEFGLEILKSAFMLGAELLYQLLELRLCGVDLLV